MKLLVILLALAICSPAFAWLPNEASGALSVRTPTLEAAPFDFEFSVESEWDVLRASTAFEREDDTLHCNVGVIFTRSILVGAVLILTTNEKPANNINRQTTIIGWKSNIIGVGAGAVTERYIADDIKGAIDFWIPLPNGSLTLTTDFKDVHIWRGESQYEFGAGQFRPFILGVLYLDGDNRFYQVKGGIIYKLKGKSNE